MGCYLNHDELTIVCGFLQLTNPNINLNLSLVNQDFYSIASSDLYWKKIIEKYKMMDESVENFQETVNIKKSFVKFRKMQCFKQDPYPSTPHRIALSSGVFSIAFFLLTLCLIVPGIISLTSQLSCERKWLKFETFILNDTVPNQIKNRYVMELSIKDTYIRFSSVSIYECFVDECELSKYENFTTFCTYDPRKKAPRLNTQLDLIGLFSSAGICLFISFSLFLISLIIFLIGLQSFFEYLYRNNYFDEKIERRRVYFSAKRGKLFRILDFYLKFTGFSEKKVYRGD